MITQNEISSLNLSPTKKDFVQIWNELIEVASKITERWDPTSTNESDPGIVLLKVLAGIADKLNYNIDKNILEAYMPTAAQMESMRKLCELVGYDIKYYQSAETRVRISYTGNTSDISEDNEERLPNTGLALPKFTTITNADKDIAFVTTNPLPVLFTNSTPWVEVPCIEGQISQCESINDNNLITISQLDASNRYYLPEIQIAENGIFVYNATASLADGDAWVQVSNLNTQPAGNRIYKFGYDSSEGRPYLAFPDDVGSLIGDGLFIYFVRTSGLSGNISPRTLEIIEIPTSNDPSDEWKNYSAEQFEVVNVDATTNGANIESISAAYSNFKKTVGTFDTLVTCRDYMNKIYSLMDASNSPYVSNILVTDIRNDINNAITLCSCNEFGILYKETPLTKTVLDASIRTLKKVDDGNGNIVNKLFIEQSAETEVPLLDHFDLTLYPFKTFTQVSSGVTNLVDPYNRSFTYTEQMNREIEASLADFKTCAHRIVQPDEGDVVAINNYLQLDAHIATSTRVSETEADAILHNVKVALVNEFNLRNLDFGEEIPFDSILSVIENADSRIKVVSLQEPILLTTFSVKEREGSTITSKEYGIASTTDRRQVKGVNYGDKHKTAKGETAKDIYNKLALRNILAGRASLFDYNETFIPNNAEKPYTVTKDITKALDNVALLLNDPIIATQMPGVEGDALLEKLTRIADKINKAKAGINTPGEHLLYDENEPIRGFFGGVVTYVTFEQEAPVVYETYEHNFTPTGGIIDNIARIESTCDITSSTNTFKNITLDKNEVIKFRAPNLVTTKTFPAYVYYNFEKGSSTASVMSSRGGGSGSGGGGGSYAETISLTSFINAVNQSDKTNESDNTPEAEKFFTELWASDPVKNNLQTFVAELNPTGIVIGQPNLLATAFNTSIAIGTELALEGSSAITLVFTDQTTLTKYLEAIKSLSADENTGGEPSDLEKWLTGYLARFINEAAIDTYLEALKETTEVNFMYYALTEGTLPIWSNYVADCYKDKFGTALPNIGGTVLWRLSSTSNYPKGRLITEAGQRLYAQSGDYLTNGRVGDTTFICTNLGSDPVFYSIPEGSDVELRSGDKLFIHYTPSSTNEDGETVKAEPISIVYEGGKTDDPVIIKPSGFTLTPSDDVNRQGTSWKKTDVEFVGYGKKNLLSLAPNEQIELRSVSKVVLDTPARLYKNFDNEVLEQGSSDKVITYELKDGEYLFYTDQNTQEAAYYGSGSVVTLDKGTYIPKAKEHIEVSQILQHGLHIVPWSYEVPLSKSRKITITEYQYITLVEGDTLNTLTVDSAESTTISNQWVRCISTKANPITYTRALAETPTELPGLELVTELAGPSTSWEVCSFLELSTSPGYSQSLRAVEIPQNTENTDSAVSITNKLTIYTDEGTGTSASIEIVPQKTVVPSSGGVEVFEPVSFKLNTIAQVASGNFEKPEDNSEDASEDNPESNDEVSTLQMKVFKEEAPALLELDSLDAVITPISIRSTESSSVKSTTIAEPTNINNYWSAIDLAEKLVSNEKRKPFALNLNFMIPESDVFGIFSVYLETSQDKLATESKQDMLINGSRVFIDIPEEFGKYSDVISIYNYQKTTNNTTHCWWSEGIDPSRPNRVYLRAGLNCIKVSKSCSLLIKAEDNAKGTVIYDNLRLVNGISRQGVNLKLIDFKDTVGGANEQQLAEALLHNIAALDKKYEFYYNAPIENSLAIEFNNNIDSLSNPYTLYDVNNINNNFVVSKLDVDYLKTGLKIAKSSKY